MMDENGGKEPVFNVDKITVFEVISYSAIKQTDLQESIVDFSKILPKILDKLCPSCDQVGVQVYDQEELSKLLHALRTEQSAQALAELSSISPRTVYKFK